MFSNKNVKFCHLHASFPDSKIGRVSFGYSIIDDSVHFAAAIRHNLDKPSKEEARNAILQRLNGEKNDGLNFVVSGKEFVDTIISNSPAFTQLIDMHANSIWSAFMSGMKDSVQESESMRVRGAMLRGAVKQAVLDFQQALTVNDLNYMVVTSHIIWLLARRGTKRIRQILKEIEKQ